MKAMTMSPLMARKYGELTLGEECVVGLNQLPRFFSAGSSFYVLQQIVSDPGHVVPDGCGFRGQFQW